MSMSNILKSFQHLCAAQRTITLLNKSQILNSIIILLQKEAHNPTDKQIAQRRDNDIKQNRLTGSAFLFFSPKSPRLPFSKALPLSGLVPPHAYTFPSEEQLQSLYPSIHPSCLFCSSSSSSSCSVYPHTQFSGWEDFSWTASELCSLP